MCKQLPSYSNIENVYKDYTEYFNNTTLEYDYDPKLEFSELRYENDDRFNDNNNTNWKENKRLDKKQIIRDNPHLKHHRFSTVNQQSNTKPLSTEHVDFHLPKHNSYFAINSPSYTNRQTIERVDFQTPKLNAYFKVNEAQYTKSQSDLDIDHAKRIEQIRQAEEAMRAEQAEQLVLQSLKHASFNVNESTYVRNIPPNEHDNLQSPSLSTYYTPYYESKVTFEASGPLVFHQRPKNNNSSLNEISVSIHEPFDKTRHAEQVDFRPPNPTTYFSVNESLADQPPIVESVEFQTPKDNKYFTVKEPPYTKPPPVNKPIFQHQKNTPVPTVNKIHNTIPPSSKLVSFRQLINLSKTN
jgi:hypothetical protein